MKELTTIVFCLISIFCFSQIDTNLLTGKWEYTNTTTLKGSVIDSSETEFELEIQEDRIFRMVSGEIQVKGIWELKESSLILNGKRSDQSEGETQTMLIHKVSEKKMSVESRNEKNQKILINYSKVE